MFLAIGVTSYGQTEPKIRLANDSTNVDINGGIIDKGDEFFVNVQLNGNGNTTSRALYFDFEFQNTAFEFMNVVNTGTGGNGGVLPAGSSISMTNYTYPGYSYAGNANNTTANGNLNYINANYNFTSGGPKTIIRIYLNWATTNGLPFAAYDTLLKLRFKLKTTAEGTSWDPIKMNFAASFNENGSSGAAINEIPLTTVITQNPDATKLVKVQLDLNGNINNTHLKVGFVKADNTGGPVFNVTSTGTVSIVDSLLAPSTAYKIMVFANMDNLPAIMNSAITVSDYTTAEAEFISQNLDRTYNNTSIMTGMGYWAADVNRSGTFDGGDLTRLYAQAVGVNQLLVLPSGYTVGSGGLMSIPTFKASDFNSVTPANWASTLNPQTQQVYAFTTPAQRGTAETLSVKYVLPGDINRSHSSQVVVNGVIKTNAVASLNKGIANLAMMNRTVGFINTPQSVASINVDLKNNTVTSNTIEIPVNVNTNGNKVSALQFEFKYDASKIKFESVKSGIPSNWVVFANNTPGQLKFGAVDKTFKETITGSVVPFILKFSTIGNGLDINSLIKVTPAMDASSSTGSQLGINLNTDSIKLTGYNNF